MPIPIYSINNLNILMGKDSKLKINQFDIHRGACYVFEGKMGAGKTTFIETLYFRNKVKNGNIIFEEKDIYKYSNREYHKQVALVPQKFISPWGTVLKYMIKTFKSYSYIKNVDKRVDEMSRKMKFVHLLNRKINSLSPGELRWVLLATMIGADSKVLFIDEVELHLGKRELSNLLSILHRKINYDGITVILSTQNKDLISRISSVAITLENGRITSVRSSSKKSGKYSKKK